MTTETETIDFLTGIIKANKLHESHCVAFSTSKDHSGPFGFLASAADSYCHCWLDKDNCSPEGEGFGLYHIKTEQIEQERIFHNNYYAVQHLVNVKCLSLDSESENYWRKHYYVVPVTLQPAKLLKTDTESENDPRNP